MPDQSVVQFNVISLFMLVGSSSANKVELELRLKVSRKLSIGAVTVV